MCIDPVTALTIGSTLLGAVGGIQQAQSTAAADKYNAQVSNMNAVLADRKAKQDIEAGTQAEQQKRMQTAQLEGKQRANMAANGVDLTFGSPLDTITDTATLGELDALNIRTNTYRQAYDDKVQASNDRSSAQMSLASASNATTAGYLGAAGTILGGAGKAYGQYQKNTIGSIS